MDKSGRVIFLFVVAGIVALVISAIISPYNLSLASIAAGWISVSIPHWLFFRIALANNEERDAKKSLKRFYWGEAVKITSFMLLCAAFLVLIPIKPMLFFASMLAGQLIHWATSIIFREQRRFA